MTRVIVPILADLQWEDAEASTGSPWRRHLVRTRARIAFWRVLTWHVLKARQPGARYRAAGPVTPLRMALAVGISIAAATALLTGLAFTFLRSTETLRSATATDWFWIVLVMVPQYLSSTIAGGLLLGATVALAGRRHSRRDWVAALLVGCTCSAMTLAVVGIAPQANQAFLRRQQRAIAARTGEYMTIPDYARPASMKSRGELAEDLEQIKEFKQLGLPLKPQEIGIWVDYHFRVALAVTPIAFGFLAVGLSSIARWRVVGFALALLSIVGWSWTVSAARTLAHAGTLSPLEAAWAPNLAAALLALTLLAKPLSTLRAKLSKHPAG